MSFLSIKDPDEQDEQIANYLALKQRLKERGDYMDLRRELNNFYKSIWIREKELIRYDW